MHRFSLVFFFLSLFLWADAFAQQNTATCVVGWATSTLKNLGQIHKSEKFGNYFENRTCKTLVLPFFRAKQASGFDISGYDSTLLGQNLARTFAATLAVAMREDENLREKWEILPSNENAIFQSNFVAIRPETYAKESEENKRRQTELQADFLLCGEYELNSEGISLLSLRLTRVGHFLNPFPKAEIPVFSGNLNFPFSSAEVYSEWKTKDVSPFDQRPFKELMDQFSGIPLRPISLRTMKLSHESFTLDSLEGDLQANVFYKMAVCLVLK